MGNASAKNSAQAIANVGTSITNGVYLNCRSDCSSSQDVFCESVCPNGSCNITNVNQGSVCQANTSCVQSITSNSSLSQNVSQAVQQKAVAVSTGFGLGPADASNVANEAANVSAAINNNFSSQISGIAAASQEIIGDACNVNIYAIDQGVQNNLSTEGQQTASIVASATQSLSQSITQSATAVNLGGLILVIVIIVIVIVVGYSLTKVETVALQTGGKILIPLALLVAGYLIFAYFIKIWPFKMKPSVTSPIIVGPTWLPPVDAGGPYSQQLTATGGTGPYTWSIVESSGNDLTNYGIQLDPATGVLSGNIPSQVQPYSCIFSAYVKDSSNPPLYGAQTYNLLIQGSKTLALTYSPTSLPTAVPGQAYPTITFTASGGKSPYGFNVAGDAFYTLGLRLTADGTISGTISNSAPSGPVTFTVWANDNSYSDSTPFNFGSQQVTINVQ